MINLAGHIDARQALLPPPPIGVYDWAEQNRVLSRRWSRYAGRWHTSRMPHTKGIMDAWTSPTVREITVMKAAQIAVSETAINCVGYCITHDPGTMLWVCATAKDKHRIKDRLQALSESTRIVEQELREGRNRETLIGFQYKSMTVWLATAGSAADLGSVPCRYVIMDEVDKYPIHVGVEATSSELAAERVETYLDISKILRISTPTTEEGPINREFISSHQLSYFIECPHCMYWAPLLWQQVKWDADDLPKTARYRCIHCSEVITDDERFEAIHAGRWAQSNIEPCLDIKPDPMEERHIGFHIPRMVSLQRSRTVVSFVTSWVRCKRFPEKAAGYMNSTLGLPFEESDVEVKLHRIHEKFRVPWKMGHTPNDVQIVTAAVDVQQNYFRYGVRGWAAGGKSYLIMIGEVPFEGTPRFDLLDPKINRTWVNEAGREVPTMAIMVDSNYRPAEVYAYADTAPNLIYPTRGSEQLKAAFKTVKRGDESGGIQWMFRPSWFKDEIYSILSGERTAANAMLSPEDTPDWYFVELCAEKRVRVVAKRTGLVKLEYQLKYGQLDNHSLDVEVLHRLAASILDLRNLPPLDQPDLKAAQAEAEAARALHPAQDDRRPWIGRNPNWARI